MRISLLLQREPFGEILCRTLERFLISYARRRHEIKWHPRRPLLGVFSTRSAGSAASDSRQRWLCNKHLNAIFLPRPDRSDLEPVVREFSRSLSSRRRLVQRAYVALASHSRGAKLAAHAYLEVIPPVREAEHWLIIGGNHKLRILNRPAGKAFAILKSGCDAGRFMTEITTRRLAERAGMPVPPIVRVSEGDNWFEERYITGTPVNRLADQREVSRTITRVAGSLARFSLSGREYVSVAEYTKRLVAGCRRHVADNSLTDESEKARIGRCVTALEQRLAEAGPGQMSIALAHGDFQSANILADDENVWLIDWEFAGRRQLGHDGLVYAMRVRHPSGLGRRLQKFVGEPLQDPLLREWAGASWKSSDERRLSALVLMLEELALLCEENNNPCLFALNSTTWVLIEELERWLAPGSVPP